MNARHLKVQLVLATDRGRLIPSYDDIGGSLCLESVRASEPDDFSVGIGSANDLELAVDGRLVGLDLVIPKLSWITAGLPAWPTDAIERDLIVDRAVIRAGEIGELDIDISVKANASKSELLIDLGFDGLMSTVVRMSPACLAIVNDGQLVAFVARLDSSYSETHERLATGR